jgi:hypothetical protein
VPQDGNNNAPHPHRGGALDDHPELSAVIPESADSYRTPRSSPRAVIPRLPSSKSAPPTAMAAMLQPSPSQEAFRALTRAESFHGFTGGDTQPMDTQIYRDYTESMYKPSTSTPPRKKVLNLAVSPGGRFSTYDATTLGTLGTDKTPRTLADGDAGFVDLAWPSESPAPQSPSSNYEELLASPQTQFQVPELPQKAVMPETPAMAGHKRTRSGEILASGDSTAKKTPGFSQLFGAVPQRGPAMSASQLFAQTQAPSSPALDLPRSDPIASRPSPHIERNTGRSSPQMTTSSPAAYMHARPASSGAIEPRERYRSMRESQEQRAARLREELSTVVSQIRDFDDDSQELGPRRMQRAISDQTLYSNRNTSRPGSRPASGRKPQAVIDLVTPGTTRKLGRVEFDDLSDDDEGEEDGMLMNEDDHADGGVEGAADDVYDEFGQTVLRSQRDDGDDEDLNDDDGGVQVDDDGDPADVGKPDDARLEEDKDGTAHLPLVRGLLSVTATQLSAVKDSQPGRTNNASQHGTRHTGQQSSMSSFVPGSQYAGKTSQDQAHLRNTPAQKTGSSEPEAIERVPSSPPLPEGHAIPVGSLGASGPRQSVLTRPQPGPDSEKQTAAEQEIPDSDLAEAPKSIKIPSAVPTLSRGDSNSLQAPFSTARAHQSFSGQSPWKNELAAEKPPLKAFASQASRPSIESPFRSAGIRKFTDIAADPRPSASAESQVDIDSLLNGVITTEDQEFMEAISSPVQEQPTKRRRLNHTRSSKSESVFTSPIRHSRYASVRMQQLEAEPAALEVEVPKDPITIHDLNREAEAAAAVPTSNTSKDNEPIHSTPDDPEPLRGTNESVKRREEAGAHAVSQLLSGRRKSVKYVKRHPSKLAGNRRKSLATSALPEEKSKESANDASRPKLKLKLSGSAKERPREGEEPEPEPRKFDEGSTESGKNERRASRTTDAPQPDAAAASSTDGLLAPVSASPPAAERRILALWKGTTNSFYPATWLGSSLDGKSYKVRFDDCNITNLDAQHVRAFDLRVGDNIKVDLAGMRKESWIIKDFGLVAQTDDERVQGTDMHGHVTVILQAKPTARNSLPAKDADVQRQQGEREILVEHVYLTHSMWPSFASRKFNPPAGVPRAPENGTRLVTPSAGIQTPLETPISRSRRLTIPSTKAKESRQRPSHLRDESVASSNSRFGAGIFSGMAFAISYGSNENEKAEITRNIERNGGIILEGGFEELFELPDFDDSSETPTKRSPTKHRSDDAALRLKPQFEDLGFVALIADRHSRRAKYVQALALGLPTLSGRWITDCLNATEANGTTKVLPSWTTYLLPAGESAYLNGAVRSRTLLGYDADNAKQADTMANRSLLLNGDGVLIVASKRTKAVWERRKAYAFLTLALGAGSVKRVNDLTEAKGLVNAGLSADSGGEGGWKWIYVDGTIAEASVALFGKNGVAGAKKRKRGEDVGMQVRSPAGQLMSATDGLVKVVNDEFVVQSLILGRLVE